MNFKQIAAEVKLKRLFICDNCNNKEMGETEWHSFDVTTSQEIKTAIDDTNCKSNYMPNGWSYNGKFKCGRCNG